MFHMLGYYWFKLKIGYFFCLFEWPDSTCTGSQLGEREILLESEGHVPIGSTQGIQNNQSDSFTASGETQGDAEKENSKNSLSPSYYDNKSAFSSMVGLMT